MAENTKIQWCDYTFNPLGSEASGATRVVAASVQWNAVKHWNSGTVQCSQCGDWHNDKCRYTHCDCGAAIDQHCFPSRQRVFVASLADVFEDWQGPMVDAQGRRLFWSHSRHPSEAKWHWINGHHCAGGEQPVTMADVRARLFELIDECPNLDFMLLTKRPENIRRFWQEQQCDHCGEVTCGAHRAGVADRRYRHNVWLYTSVACQEDADRNILELLRCRDLTPVLGVSAEPLVGPISFSGSREDGWQWCHLSGIWERQEWDHETGDCSEGHKGPSLDHVIVGGESGPNARPCNIEWIREIVGQCKAAGVPCFVKQLGARPFMTTWLSLKDPKGGEPSEWLGDLRVREMPFQAQRLGAEHGRDRGHQ